jgi:glutathione S-transferase
MITLYTFGPAFGLPDPSPFVMKAEVLLKMAGVPYRTDTTGFRKAPKGKQPYIEDGGEIIPDSTFIRFHLEKKYGIDFDRSLDQEQRAIAWASEKLAEDHLYWAIVEARWCDDANFNNGPRKFFAAVPAPLRPFVIAMVRRQVRKNLHGHGIGRHSRPEIVTLATRGIDAILHGLRAIRRRCNDLCLRGRTIVPELRNPVTDRDRAARQPWALRRAHDGALLPRADDREQMKKDRPLERGSVVRRLSSESKAPGARPGATGRTRWPDLPAFPMRVRTL